MSMGGGNMFEGKYAIGKRSGL